MMSKHLSRKTDNNIFKSVKMSSFCPSGSVYQLFPNDFKKIPVLKGKANFVSFKAIKQQLLMPVIVYADPFFFI